VKVLSCDGAHASVCAVTEKSDGGWKYLVEFEAGSAIETDEHDLTSAQVPLPPPTFSIPVLHISAPDRGPRIA
jgi:hypothetical protein